MEELNYVAFDKDSFTIKIHACDNPVEAWNNLVRALIWFIGNENPNFTTPEDYRFRIYELLSALLPTWQTMQKMGE